MQVLTEIQFKLPKNTFSNVQDFTSLFSVTTDSQEQITFKTKPRNYSPFINLEFSDIEVPSVLFLSSNSILCKLEIRNTTNEEWISPLEYSHIALDELLRRITEHQIHFLDVDHLGVNIPSKGENTELERVYEILAPKTLLHNFPNNKNWKFILPGTEPEIINKKLDYSIERTPKFEFVNFETSSTPLIQIDLTVNTPYKRLLEIFPEAIPDNKLKNLWVYIENTSGVDICLVLNQQSNGWTSFFDGQLFS